jgi:hypothetical protein
LRPPRPVHIGLYELHLTPLELIDRIAALVPPPRTHRHRYFGVLAPNSPLRAAVTALATPAQAAPVLGASISTGECAPGVVPMSSALPSQSEPVLPKRAAHYLWAVLIARIYEVFPLLCPLCGGHMRIIAFITHSADIRHILDHIGADSEPPRISPARGPPRGANRASRLSGATGTGLASAHQLVNEQSGDFDLPRTGSAPGTRRAPQITLLNAAPPHDTCGFSRVF